ncbi:hypothetical protein [Microbacterium sp. 2FI]|uniref:SCO7613 C-terminal domain-containing membrane protein n=1 Tax=Microbacterium sp. 2FI TaxID=2502193 RepID=UPI001485450E|nr:hypothetical protein [Microbacterium sp. 2FI]
MAHPDDGTTMWPGSPQDLADAHMCPSCFTPLTRATCDACGLELGDPRAARLLEIGRRMIALEAERQVVIETLREASVPAPPPYVEPEPEPEPEPETEPEPEPEPWELAPEPLRVEHVPVPTLVTVESQTKPHLAPTPAAAATPAAASVVAPAPRRRLSVPVLLLIVGVSLVGIAAIFFLVYAWFQWGIAVRALIIGAITVATIGIASLLRRRSLTATAEGIAVLGVLLLGLDAWAVRANDFFGAGQVSGPVYAGIGVIVVGVLCRVWAKLSGLRSPDIAAVLALPVGIGLLIGGISGLPTAEAITAGLLGAAAGGLLHALPAPWSSARARPDAVPERTALAVVGVSALVAAAIVAFIASPDSIAVPLWSGGAIVVLGAVHAWMLRPRLDEEALPAATALAATASATAATVATLVGWQVAYRGDLPVYTLLLGPVVAVAVPVVLDRAHRRLPGLSVARIAAGALGALSLVAAVLLWGALATIAIASGWTTWLTDAFATPASQPDGALLAAFAGIVIAALLFAAPTLGAPRLRHVRVIAAAVVVLTGVAVVAIPSVLVGAATLVAVAAAAALTRPSVRIGAAVAAGIAAATAFTAGTATPGLWLVGIAVAVGVPIVAQAIVRPTGTIAAALTVTSAAVATISAFLAPAAFGAATGTPPNPLVAFVLLQWIALVAVLCAVVVPSGLPTRRAAAWSGYVLFAASLLPHAIDGLLGRGAFDVVVGATAPVAGEPALGIVRSAALLVLVALIALGRTRLDATASSGAALLVAPLAASLAFAVACTFGAEQHGARPLATTGAAVVVVWVAALWSMRHPANPRLHAPDGDRRALPGIRTFVDLGALAAVLALAWDATTEPGWAILLVIAAGFVGASITRGWAGPAAAHTVGVPSTRVDGVITAQAPRRLLVWPAFAGATAALWWGLAASPDAGSLLIEAYVIPPAAGLLVFAALLVWLRRHVESAVAVCLSFTLGLIVPVAVTWSTAPIRSVVIALVAAVLCLALTLTPALRARIPALAGATTALVALAFASVERAVNPAPFEAPLTVAWLLLLVATAYASAWGVARVGTAALYARLVPSVALAVTVIAALPAADDPWVVGIALTVLAALHLAAAAVDRTPFDAATRWASLAGATAFAVAGVLFGVATVDGVVVVEVVSLPLAAVVLAGSAVAQWRQHRHGQAVSPAEQFVWLAGLGLAVLPSIISPVEPLRLWLVIGVALVLALVAVLAPGSGARAVRSSSAVVLTAAAVLMGVRALEPSTFPLLELAASLAGAGALLVSAAMVWRRSFARNAPSTVIAAAGAALLIATAIVFGDGDLARTVITVSVAGVVGVGGAALIGLERWRDWGSVLAVAGFAGAVVAIASRIFELARFVGDVVAIEPDLWALVGLAITAAIGIMALRASAGTPSEAPAGLIVGFGFAAAVVLFTAAELLQVGAGTGTGTGADQLRTVFTMTALTTFGIIGVVWRKRLGLALAVASAVLAGSFGILALTAFALRPVELVTIPLAIGMLALGARALVRDPATRSWPALGPGLAMLLVPSLLHDFGPSELWRVVGLGVVSIAIVVAGAVWRLQAPLVLGSAVLLIHAISQLWPWISAGYTFVPWWLWLGIGGALLIFLAARYEKNMRALRTSFTAVTSLR